MTTTTDDDLRFEPHALRYTDPPLLHCELVTAIREQPDDVFGIRARALLALTWEYGLRPATIADCTVGQWLTNTLPTYMPTRVQRSPDLAARHRQDPSDALQQVMADWLDLRGTADPTGALFVQFRKFGKMTDEPLNSHGIRLAITDALRRTTLPRAADYTANSPYIGGTFGR